MTTKVQLRGRLFLRFNLETLTGLHIGGTEESISIGGVDKTVIRNPFNDQPYIPGSSLRGKIRSLTEKYRGAAQNTDVGRVTIHTCRDLAAYQDCHICHIYGLPGEREFSSPTRLIVRDTPLTPESAEALNKMRTSLPFTEVKTEVTIDRVTAAANPRQMERVPAGALFGPVELVYNLFCLHYTVVDSKNKDERTNKETVETTWEKDLERFETLLAGLQLLEDDYLGGLGARGSGRVALKDIKVGLKTTHTNQSYRQETAINPTPYATLNDLMTDLETMTAKVKAEME